MCRFVHKFCFSLQLKTTFIKLSFCLSKCWWNAKCCPLNLQNKPKTNKPPKIYWERKTEVMFCGFCMEIFNLLLLIDIHKLCSWATDILYCYQLTVMLSTTPARLNQLSNCHSQLKLKLNVFWTLIIKYNMTNYLLMIHGTLLQINVLFFFLIGNHIKEILS